MIIEKANSIQGTISIPGDRYITHCAVILASVAQGTTVLYNHINCPDTMASISALRAMGVSIGEHKSENSSKACLYIQGNGLGGLRKPRNLLDIGNSVTAFLMLSGILSAQTFTCTLTGDETIRKLNLDHLIKPLHLMGAKITGNNGTPCAPLIITGRSLRGIQHVNALSDADIKAALLLAGLYGSGKTVIYEPRQSRNHMEILMKQFGAETAATHTDGPKGKGFCDTTMIEPCLKLHPRDIRIPGDFSLASYFLSAALMVPESRLILPNIGINASRSLYLSICMQMGADIRAENIRFVNGEKTADLTICHSNLNALIIPSSVITSILDEIPILTVLATQASGTTVIHGIREYRLHTGDKIDILIRNLRNMGADISYNEDELLITGRQILHGALLDSANDPQITMALSIAGLIAEPGLHFPDSPNTGQTEIKDTTSVHCIFPDFYKLLESFYR